MRIVPKSFMKWGEEDLKQLHPRELRMQEAFYFYELFLLACGQKARRLKQVPHEEQFCWIAFADTFLMMLVSVEEHVGKSIRKRLQSDPLFSFLKQLRNITVHTTVLGARKHTYGVSPIVNRVYDLGGIQGDFVDPKLNYDRLQLLLDGIVSKASKAKKRAKAMKKSPPQSHTGHVKGSRQFLQQWKKDGNPFVILREFFERALEFVGNTCKVEMEEP